MARKLIMNLSARAVDSAVYLSFYKGLELYNEKSHVGKEVFRIFRKTENNFVFSTDYMEFFDSLDFREAELIYEGSLEPINNRKYVFEDTFVETGNVYVYWVSSNRGDLPVGPAAVKVRDKNVWWTYEHVKSYINELCSKYPTRVSMKKYGVTSMKKDIFGLAAGNIENAIAFMGAVHPGESGPELILPVLEKLLENDAEILNKVGIAVLPSVNIDQRERLVEGIPCYLRTNHNGVDLNRNFDAAWDSIDYGYGLNTSEYGSMTYRGLYPESEDETQAVVEFLNLIKPKAVFSFHSLACICDDYFITTTYAKDDEEYLKGCRTILKQYTSGFRGSENADIILRTTGSAGSLPTWAYLKSRVPCFDLEFRGDSEGAACLTDRTTYDIIKLYRERHYNGIKKVLDYLADGCEGLQL